MATRADVVAEARAWLGTRWEHQARLKGVGCDCAGLVIGVARELGLADVDFFDYSRYPDGVSLRAACARYMTPIHPSDARLGDVLAFTIERDPQHLGIVAELDGRPTLIHSYVPARKVVENDLDAQWIGRIRGAYRLPGIDG